MGLCDIGFANCGFEARDHWQPAKRSGIYKRMATKVNRRAVDLSRGIPIWWLFI